MKTIPLLTLPLLILPCLCGQSPPPDILPTPQYLEPLGREVRLTGDAIRVWTAHGGLDAARALLAGSVPGLHFADARALGDAHVVLWDDSAAKASGVVLNFLDRALLRDSELREQSYVVRSTDSQIWVVGGGPMGVLYGAATVGQLLQPSDGGAVAQAVYIRDNPDFKFRASADWLLNIELNRWALDRGQGLEAYKTLVRRKLDQAARYKINFAVIDGFGWDVEQRIPGYAPMMRDLNAYARRLGIHLQYGGYGAAYDMAQRENEYHGKLFLNRESYPDGKVYQCLDVPGRDGGVDPRTMGDCRANEELNRLKGDELARFVDAVEPGALYIHHEDCCVFEDFQKAWRGRCERCRRRWPNDALNAADGGAGALAHGYSSLVNAVNSVRHPERNFEAKRDTEIVLVSPVYMPTTSSSKDWSDVLELWRIITGLLPKTDNLQICFRETLPQAGGGKRWIELFNGMMQAEKLPFGAYLFSVAGADGFLTDYPVSAGPAMNAHFLGARTVYNSTGGPYHAAQEPLSAEYAWNVRSTGFYRDPHTEAETDEIAKWVYTPGEPSEVFGTGKLFDRICKRLYGERAAKPMAELHRLVKWLPEEQPEGSYGGEVNMPLYYRGRRPLYLRRTWNYIHAMPYYWFHLLMDSGTWGDEVGSYKDGDTPAREIHRRLARRWTMGVELHAQGAKLVDEALAAGPRADAVEDLEFLRTLYPAHEPMVAAMRDYHAVRAEPGRSDRDELLTSALANARKADAMAAKLFPHPVDTSYDEVASLRRYPAMLAAAIEKWRASAEAQR